MELTNLKYGNATEWQLWYLSPQATSYLERHIHDLTSYTFPGNDSGPVKIELNELVENLRELQKEPTHIDGFLKYDGAVDQVFKNFLTHNGAMSDQDAEIFVNQVVADVNPLVYKLKYYFQRPRPFQLAYYHNLKLFPIQSFAADSPSYPSGHALLASMIASILGNKYPRMNNHVMQLASDIGNSRVFLGLNYQSDVDYAKTVADILMKDKELLLKYKL